MGVFQLKHKNLESLPHYSESIEAPVYKLGLNADKYKATEIGKEIMTEIFNKNGTTKFDVVP